MTTIKETIDRLDQAPPPPRFPAMPRKTLSGDWQRTGSTRYRIGWGGKVILMIEETAGPEARWRDATQLDLLMTVAVPRSQKVIPWTGAADAKAVK